MNNLAEFYDCFSEMTREIANAVIVNFFVYITVNGKLDYKSANKVLNESSTVYYQKLADFTNIFWNNYHNNNDDNLVKKINELKKYNIIVHDSCLFQFLLNHMCAFINGFVTSNGNYQAKEDMDIKIFKAYAKYIFDALDQDFKNQFINQKINNCGDHCKVRLYDKKVPFVVMKITNEKEQNS